MFKSFQIEREAWIRFLVAIAGLTLAFGAAIFSTVTRQAGNVWATAIFASAALLIAGLVGLTTVPYLARRVALHRVREAFDYDVTREGMVYLAIVLAIAVAALNTGNNLLFIVVSAMLAAIIVSGVASAAILRSLELDVGLPEHVFAGESVLVRLSLNNLRRWLPSLSVSVAPPKSQHAHKRLKWERSMFVFPAKAPREKQWLHLPDLSLRLVADRVSAPGIITARAYFPYLPPRAIVSRELELDFARRGRYVQDGFGLSTRFPFSFLVKTRKVLLAREIVVYPSVLPTDELFEILPMITGEFEAFVRGRGHDLYRIREYLPEDSARHVDWKASARTGSLKVREFSREDERKLRVVFDNPAESVVDLPSYERGIALAASLAWHFAGENTDLSFAAPGYQGANDIYEFLRYLALVDPRPAAEAPKSVLDELQVSDDYNVILTARPRGSIPTALWSCSYFLFFGEGK
ncbi:MAG: DUF58 domain-containing protein [Acidobacteriia bacterium]|nr:DUF58 domain-containing protein [Terriglobia bacterium]